MAVLIYVNEDPVITSSATTSVEENQTSVLTVMSADVDGGTPNYSIVGGADAAIFSIDSDTGVLSFSAPPDFETATDADTDNVYNVSVKVAEGNGGTDTQDIAITVTDVNDDPVITSTSSVSAAENQSTVLTVTSTDADDGIPSYSIAGGTDAANFSIDNDTGVLSFNVAPDFESATDADTDNVYNVTVEVEDGNGGTDTQDIVVTVTDVNDDPVNGCGW